MLTEVNMGCFYETLVRLTNNYRVSGFSPKSATSVTLYYSNTSEFQQKTTEGLLPYNSGKFDSYKIKIAGKV